MDLQPPAPVLIDQSAKQAAAEQRKVAAQAAQVVGASTRSVEKAARVERSAPDLLPQVQAGTMALDKAHREEQQRERQVAAMRTHSDHPEQSRIS